MIRQEYHDLCEVFSKERATQLPPHRPWDCTIELLLNAMPPKCTVYPVSLPVSEAMEEYIEETLAAGFICPLTANAAAGFFFVANKDGDLRPLKFEACHLKERITFQSSDPKFSVRPDGSLYAEQDVKNPSEPIQFVVTAQGSKGTRVWKTIVKLVITRHHHPPLINQLVGVDTYARKSTTDAIFALRILMEKYRDGQRELHCVFVDLEKAYERVPREELWYCMRKSGVAEKYVRVVQDMYERSRTVVRCAVGQTEEFNVEVGLHQGSALSPFLFAMVMDQLSEEVRQESPWTMMFADDIVICSESREQVEESLERWRFALERRGMKVSRSKTEYMCVNEREGSGTVRLQGEEVKKIVDKVSSHHNNYHNLSQHQRGFSTNGLHWQTRDWIIPPIRASADSRRAFSPGEPFLARAKGVHHVHKERGLQYIFPQIPGFSTTVTALVGWVKNEDARGMHFERVEL
ncbi:hypothetical protein QTP86_027087 [Hemibagrus guttatus]|nr:hypothetical protein QTP86_027087 [Hemibagrus guttatus]